MKMGISGVYAIEDVKTGNLYVGSSSDISKRWSHYRSFFKNNEHRYKELQEAFNEGGKARVKYTILEECSIEELEDRENWWLQHVQKIEGWTLINKQKHATRSVKVNTKKMKLAQQNERNGNCKYKRSDIIRVLELIFLEKINRKDVAAQFNMSYNYVTFICTARKWKSVVLDWKKENLEGEGNV
ncbi:GIY-YIG nuclease family protein [Clostridium grantii]|uniref:Group I intron endonuclease n=1 Tax=Clostridium grantii DSM 8605 TaxID=1121316 RepID=A0A1M5SD57_9CLOT|nr:GIY-YIG nuclease family protein [Clostridium grantii]SHH36527.1 group I intron endonuclease [Clostridium grantii DSM 8605]